MSSRLPRSRPSRCVPMRAGRPIPNRSTDRWLGYRDSAQLREAQMAARIGFAGARLDRDPNGYCIAKDGRFVARCPNLAAVEAWLIEQERFR